MFKQTNPAKAGLVLSKITFKLKPLVFILLFNNTCSIQGEIFI